MAFNGAATSKLNFLWEGGGEVFRSLAFPATISLFPVEFFFSYLQQVKSRLIVSH